MIEERQPKHQQGTVSTWISLEETYLEQKQPLGRALVQFSSERDFRFWVPEMSWGKK